MIGGAWIKSRVARAILLGVDIFSVADFFEFCQTVLTTAANQNNRLIKFTSNRFFYLLELTKLAAYRAMLPMVETWPGLRAAHCFRVLDAHHARVGRWWVGCNCDACFAHDFANCEHCEYFRVNGEDMNAMEEKVLTLTPVTGLDKQKQLELSEKDWSMNALFSCCLICMPWQFVKQLKTSDIVAVRGGKIVSGVQELDDRGADSDSEEEEDDEEDEVKFYFESLLLCGVYHL